MASLLGVMLTRNTIQIVHVVITLMLCKWHPEYRISMIDKGVPFFICSLASFIISIFITLFLKVTIKHITTSTLEHAIISLIITYIFGVVFFMIAVIYSLWKWLRTMTRAYLWVLVVILPILFMVFFWELYYTSLRLCRQDLYSCFFMGYIRFVNHHFIFIRIIC